MVVAAAGQAAAGGPAREDRRGAREQFLREIEQLMPNLRRFARSLARDGEEADDIVQDALVAALDKIHLFEPGSNLRAWLFTITRNTFINHQRRRRVRAHLPLDDEALELQAPPAQEASVAQRRLAAAYDRLPRPHREVIALVVFESMSYDHAAEILSVAVGTVRSRLSRARAGLRKAIG
jgi:RNA polymerase sigma-70 factor, ECF subfamily